MERSSHLRKTTNFVTSRLSIIGGKAYFSFNNGIQPFVLCSEVVRFWSVLFQFSKLRVVFTAWEDLADTKLPDIHILTCQRTSHSSILAVVTISKDCPTAIHQPFFSSHALHIIKENRATARPKINSKSTYGKGV